MWTEIRNCRPASREEMDVVAASLKHAAVVPLTRTVEELTAGLIVVGACQCGCPSVDFVSDEEECSPSILADTSGAACSGAHVGVIVWGHPDRVTNLEVVCYGSKEEDCTLPRLESLVD